MKQKLEKFETGMGEFLGMTMNSINLHDSCWGKSEYSKYLVSIMAAIDSEIAIGV